MPRNYTQNKRPAKYAEFRKKILGKGKKKATAVMVRIPKKQYRLPAFESGQEPEIKAIDFPTIAVSASGQTVQNFALMATPPVGYTLNCIAVGSGYFNRIGSKINMKSLHIRGFVGPNGTTATDMGRIVVIYDRQTNGALPALTTILSQRDSAGTAQQSGTSEVNLDYRDRFIILRDYEIYFPSTSVAGGVDTTSFPGEMSRIDVNMFIPMKDLLTHYKASSAPPVVGDISCGGVYIYCVSNVAANPWSFTYSGRLRYDDL